MGSKKVNAIKSRINKTTFNKGNEKYIGIGKIAANGPAYKSTLKRKAKRFAVGAGIAAGVGLGAAAVGAGAAGIHKGITNRNATRLPGPTVTPMTKREDNQMLKKYRQMGMM